MVLASAASYLLSDLGASDLSERGGDNESLQKTEDASRRRGGGGEGTLCSWPWGVAH